MPLSATTLPGMPGPREADGRAGFRESLGGGGAQARAGASHKRYGGSTPVSGHRWIVAGSPDYLARFGEPDHPADLQHHRCLRFRIGDASIYRWEFERGGEVIEVDAPGSLM